VQARMLELLARMERELDARGVYAGTGKPFVDWANGFSGDSAEARRAVDFEYLLAFRDAASLLRLAGDEADAAKWDARADAMTVAAQKYLVDAGGAFGDRWQTNAIAVMAGAVTTDAQRAAVWRVLERTVAGRKPEDVITPYYGNYLLTAMARLGHRREAVAWMKSYWGGMLDAGATSFWEAWDPAWAGGDPHARLEADDKVGYNASLAHGWSSGPAAWLMEEVLGVKALAPRFRRVEIRPALAGLDWAKGAVATPHGAVKVEILSDRVIVTIPTGIEATVVLPVGKVSLSEFESNGDADGIATKQIVLRIAGRYVFPMEDRY
jgi:alpha-L-rhamnosidase